MNVFRVYTTPACSYCVAAKNLLRSRGLGFEEIDVSRDPALRKDLIERTQRRTVPQIYYGDRHIGGFDDLVVYFSRQSHAS